MTGIELVNEHILFSPEEGKFFFIFERNNLKSLGDGGIILEANSKVLDFGAIMEQSGKAPTAESVDEVIKELLEHRQQGRLQEFI